MVRIQAFLTQGLEMTDTDLLISRCKGIHVFPLYSVKNHSGRRI